MPLSIGDKLGPYEIVAPLGSGGMGEVYRARDRRLGRDVALKVLPPELAHDPVRRQRFEQESRAVAALNHPNIVAVYDVGDNYFIEELVDGDTLRITGALPLRRSIGLAVQIAEGLAAAHARNVTHRDLKPENIMVTRDGRAKVLDFGLAKVARPPGVRKPPRKPWKAWPWARSAICRPSRCAASRWITNLRALRRARRQCRRPSLDREPFLRVSAPRAPSGFRSRAKPVRPFPAARSFALRRLLEDIAYNAVTGSGQFDFSLNGTVVYRSGGGGATNEPLTIEWLDRTGKTQPLLAKAGSL